MQQGGRAAWARRARPRAAVWQRGLGGQLHWRNCCQRRRASATRRACARAGAGARAGAHSVAAHALQWPVHPGSRDPCRPPPPCKVLTLGPPAPTNNPGHETSPPARPVGFQGLSPQRARAAAVCAAAAGAGVLRAVRAGHRRRRAGRRQARKRDAQQGRQLSPRLGAWRAAWRGRMAAVLGVGDAPVAGQPRAACITAARQPALHGQPEVGAPLAGSSGTGAVGTWLTPAPSPAAPFPSRRSRSSCQQARSSRPLSHLEFLSSATLTCRTSGRTSLPLPVPFLTS
jgi:hypothetical protein